MPSNPAWKDMQMRAAYAVAVAVMVLGCTRHSAVFENSSPVEAGSVVSMYTFNGDIDVEWYDGDVMDLGYTKTSWVGEGELDKVEVTVTEEDGMTVIRAEKLQSGAQVGVDLDVSLPRSVAVEFLETSNGDVTVTGGSGDANVDTSNGDVVFTGFEGSVMAATSNGDVTVRGGTLRGADTSNGDIVAEIRSVSGDRTVLDTSNSDIEVYVSPDLDLRIIMDTSNGSVSVSGLSPASVRIDGSDGTASLNAATHELILDTSNGDIDVFGLDSTNADVQAE